jgi:hypothetical protein
MNLPKNLNKENKIISFEWDKVQPNLFKITYTNTIAYFIFQNNGEVCLSHILEFNKILSSKANKSMR